MKVLSQFLNLFYPKICLCCQTHLFEDEAFICLTCRFDLPFVDNGDYKSNPTTQIFKGRIPLNYGASFLFYRQTGKTKELIHQLKYKGDQTIGTFIGNWFGRELALSKEFSLSDLIIPVPLHKSKEKKRGYNQLTTFGESLSEVLKIPFDNTILERRSFTKTQTQKKRIDRFLNTESRFVVENPQKLNDKHIILIDDVVTTGATLEACCKEIMKSENTKISIITIGITE